MWWYADFVDIILVVGIVGMGKETTKRLNRRGNLLVDETCIADTNHANELGRVQLVRRRPFRSPSNDVCQAFARSNFDLQFMLRAVDPDSDQA